MFKPSPILWYSRDIHVSYCFSYMKNEVSKALGALTVRTDWMPREAREAIYSLYSLK